MDEFIKEAIVNIEKAIQSDPEPFSNQDFILYLLLKIYTRLRSIDDSLVVLRTSQQSNDKHSENSVSM